MQVELQVIPMCRLSAAGLQGENGMHVPRFVSVKVKNTVSDRLQTAQLKPNVEWKNQRLWFYPILKYTIDCILNQGLPV